MHRLALFSICTYISEHRQGFRKFLRRHRPIYRPPQRAQQTIVIGDFNAKVGYGDVSCLGKFSYVASNKRD